MKKFMLMLLPVSLIAILSGCSPFVKEVDYQPIANDLNEKNMDRILNAVDGYAEINQYITISENEIDIEDNDIQGFFNTDDGSSYGVYSQRNVNNEVQEIEGNYFYENGNFIVNNQKGTGEKMLILSMHLQGIEKLKPETYTYGLDEPPSIRYKLTESQFQRIINDDLNIQYDKFEEAKVLFQLREVGNTFEIKTITISANLEKNIKGSPSKVLLSSRTDLLLTEENGDSSEKYEYQKEKFNANQR
jgi:hypothetical protein